MCKFFSFAWDGGSNFLYSDWELRKTLLGSRDNPDSHTFILTHFNISADKQQNWSTYEYNHITKEFTVDTKVEGHDVSIAEAWVRELDFKKIEPQLVIKPILNPLKGRTKKVTEKDKELLRQWETVYDSVWDSVEDSVRDSVWDSVGDSTWDSVRDSVGNSVGNSVRDSVWDSVWDSVGDSVWDSVRDLTWAYISSFFDIKYDYDFSSAVKLWERGFVPSFDGEMWRLHSGKNAKVVYEEEYKQGGL